MKYVDANIFICAVVGVENKAQSAKQILQGIASGKIEAYTSALTWDELVWNVRKNLGVETAKEEGTRFLLFPNLKILAVDGNIIMEAQRLMLKYNLKPRDSIHAACAIKNGIKDFISDDPDFDTVSEIKRIRL